MDLRGALDQISEIRQHMARSQTFRGYRSATTAFSGVIGILAASLQDILIPAPAENLFAYVELWAAVAAVGILMCGIEIVIRYQRTDEGVQRDLTVTAVEQFLPSIFGGGLITAAIAWYAPAAGWMLPGVWSILFALGILASRTVLPRAIIWGGAWYLLAGLFCLVLARGPWAFSPWAMGISFGAGQLLAAAILYWNLERCHASPEE